MILRLKRKYFSGRNVSEYDVTDDYKTMTDAELLAEEKKSNADTYKKAARIGGYGAGAGALAGSIIGGVAKKSLKGAGIGAAVGALAGGVTGTGAGLAITHKDRERNRFINDRLSYAQKLAERRERRDWVANHRRRVGYSFGNPN